LLIRSNEQEMVEGECDMSDNEADSKAIEKEPKLQQEPASELRINNTPKPTCNFAFPSPPPPLNRNLRFIQKYCHRNALFKDAEIKARICKSATPSRGSRREAATNGKGALYLESTRRAFP
jgi:hypothetical protein